MKLVVGLGNPGKKYLNNRHNVGHMVIDFLNSKKIASYKLSKTDCFMNVSGGFVRKQMEGNGVHPEELYVVHDDLDIPLGMFKIQFASGPKVHNGITSIEETLGTDQFWRVRVGVDARPLKHQGGRATGEEYVLSDFNAEELKALDDVFARVATRLKDV